MKKREKNKNNKIKLYWILSCEVMSCMGWLTRDAHFCNVNSKIERHSAHLWRWGWGGWGRSPQSSTPSRQDADLRWNRDDRRSARVRRRETGTGDRNTLIVSSRTRSQSTRSPPLVSCFAVQPVCIMGTSHAVHSTVRSDIIIGPLSVYDAYTSQYAFAFLLCKSHENWFIIQYQHSSFRSWK